MTSLGPAEPPAAPLLECPFTQDDLPRLRMLVDQYADREGLPEPQRGDFIVAVDAVATNAITHAGGGGTLTLRRVDGHLECHIRDSGPGFTADVIPPLAPGVGDPCEGRGRGLWLARHVTEYLKVSTGSIGAVVTLAMRLPH
ncbi:ATP-binding protein [Streptomyces sp. PA5.6]|uniref:ATP-binding protein n=1 Tax=Streptomyces sp. PA5.6 TaxID=3035651 RepID=UPI00390481E1